MGTPAEAAPSDAGTAGITDTERAVLGPVSVPEALAFFSAYTRDRLGQDIASVRFRAGRIDVVWGVELDDGREVVVKSHRRPVDTDAVGAAVEAKRLLRAAGFPCPEPLSGPDDVDGQLLVAETLLPHGRPPNGRDPADRRLLAAGLARHIDLLRGHPDLVRRAGPGPSWCRYQDGPWPAPHDPIVDFTTTPDGQGWLDAYAERVVEQILTHRAADEVVVGHADWYAGNAAVADGVLVGTFDWELVADTEAVVAGFAAACYDSSATSGGGMSSPEEVLVFLRDYDVARGRPLGGAEQRAAAAAAAWIVAFNARWELALDGRGEEGSSLALVRDRREDYLTVSW